jgi:ABC-type branched-subunit amino acid transport system permease subunit
MKLTWSHTVVIAAASGPVIGAAGYVFGAHWPVKLGVSLCVLYVGWQVSWGMFRNPLWPLAAFLAGALYGWLRGYPGLRIAAYGLLLAVAVDALTETVALLRKGDKTPRGSEGASG